MARADAVLVPALAVDAAGRRLGRGGGSYDRALARVGPLVPLIALIYDDELVEQVPAEGHDVPVRATASPRAGLTAPRPPLIRPPALRTPPAAESPSPFRGWICLAVGYPEC